MICSLHRTVFPWGEKCPVCEDQNIIVYSTEYDKQDRVRDTMTCQGYSFDPTRSRAIMVFDIPKPKPKEGEK